MFEVTAWLFYKIQYQRHDRPERHLGNEKYLQKYMFNPSFVASDEVASNYRNSVKCHFPHFLDRRPSLLYPYVCVYKLKPSDWWYHLFWIKSCSYPFVLFYIYSYDMSKCILNALCYQINCIVFDIIPFRCQVMNVMVMIFKATDLTILCGCV